MDRLLGPSPTRQVWTAEMVAGERTVGTLALCLEEGAALLGHERQMLDMLAHRVAVGVENARLLEKASARRAALSRIASSLSGQVEVRKLARTAVELAVKELGADAATIWRADSTQRILEQIATTGFPAEVVQLFRRLRFEDPALAAKAALLEQPQIVERLDQLPESLTITKRIFSAAGMESVVAVPLIARDQLMGVLAFASKTPHRWPEEELVLIRILAELLASAIFNASLYEEQVGDRQKLEELAGNLRAVNEQLVRANARSTTLAELAQERAAELEATISNIADAVFVCDPKGKILMINAAGLELIGIEQPSELKTLGDYLDAARVRYLNGDPVPPSELAISKALTGEVVRGVEEILYDSRNQRDRYVLVSAGPVRNYKNELVAAIEVQSDITRLKELDILKDQFITVAAHEIKTPVTAIKGFAQTLARTPDACSPRYRRALETIVQQSDRIDALLQEFLEVSRMRWGRIELTRKRIDLTALVAEAVAAAQATTKIHKLTLARRDPAWVQGDRERLDQVMGTLLDNAVRYSPHGGEIEVQVAREGNQVVVSVKDQGVGIPKERQAHLFERFYRAHIGTPFDYGGLGVALYISREIIRHHGGRMWFESEEGKGSTFYLSLPAAD